MKLFDRLKNSKIKKDKKSNKEKEENETLKQGNFNKKVTLVLKLIILAIISVVIAVLFEFYAYEGIVRLWDESAGYVHSVYEGVDYTVPFSFIRLSLFIGIIYFIGLHFIIKPRKIYEFICDKRYIIALVFLVTVVTLRLNGGSLTRMNHAMGAHRDGDPLPEIIGFPRDIRSDEWASQSIYNISQSFNNYERYSEFWRGTKTDMFTLVNAPVKTILMIGKPFLIMFLILSDVGAAYSFYWFARITAMCLATYELMRILTNNKKLLSLFGTILISFSAAVQWWYCMDSLIWLEAVLVLFNLFFETDKLRTKILCGIGEVIAVLSFIFVFYPAWQITFGYALIPVFVMIIINNIKNGNFKKVKKRDILIIVLAVVAILSLLVYWYISSKDTIEATTSTVYPGKRIGIGTDERSLFAYFYNMFMPFNKFREKTSSNKYFDNGIEKFSNHCENATMLSLYPIPMILALVYVIRNKDEKGKRDLYLILSLIVSVVLSIYCTIGVPAWFAKLTFLSMSIGARAAIPLAAINVYMLIYIMSKVIDNKDVKLIDNKIIPFVVSVIMTRICLYGDGNNYLEIWQVVLSTILFLIMFYLVLNLNKQICRRILMVMMASITLVGGLTVNPLVQSVDCIINNSEMSKVLQEYSKNEPDAVWMVNALPIHISNFVAANGVKTITTTNVYPNTELYKNIFGDDETAEAIWNRYHHPTIKISDDDTMIAKTADDTIFINLHYKDLYKTGVKYILSRIDFELEKPYVNCKLVRIIDDRFYMYELIDE